MKFPPATQSSRPKELVCQFSKKPKPVQKASGFSSDRSHWFFDGLEIFEKFLNVFDKFIF